MSINTFFQTTPAGSAPISPDALADSSENRKTARRKFTVLLIEDDVSDKNFILQTLLRSPYVHDVQWFSSGEALMQHFTEAGYYKNNITDKAPTMILLDIHMPGLDGMQILERLKEHPLTSDIPVIMVSGDISQEASTTAFKLKANAYVTKPIRLDPIHEVIETGNSWPSRH